MKNQNYKEIANKIGELTIAVAKASHKGENTVNLQKQLNKAIKNEEILLNELGLNKKDLEPQFICKQCDDKGVLERKYCDCFNNLVSSLVNKYNMNTLKPITLDDCKEIDPKIIKSIVTILNSYPANPKYLNLYFTGKVGTGKTQLTQAMANNLIEKKLFVIFTSATNLNNNFLEYHKAFDDAKPKFLQPFLDCDALFIDDLGTEPLLRNVTQEYLLTVISERIFNHKMTIITTNLSNNQFIERYGERLFSRLFDKNNSLSFNFEGNDLRLTKKK